MFRHAIKIALASLVTFDTPAAQAFFDPPWITPAAPQAGEIVSVNILGGICDGVIEQPGYPQITQNGNSIRIIEYGVHVGFPDLCIYPTGTLSVPIGNFSAGSYSLTVDFAYDDALYGPTIITLGIVPFTVHGSVAATSVPAVRRSGLLICVVLISISAVWMLRARRRKDRC